MMEGDDNMELLECQLGEEEDAVGRQQNKVGEEETIQN